MQCRLTRALLGLLLPLLALLSTVTAARAHADYDHSEPPADAVLATPPTQVRIWFTQELFRRQGQNSIEVYGSDGQRVDQADAAIDDDDRRLMTVTLSPTPASGVYTVRWQAVSAEDGHEGKGEFTFTVGSVAASAPVSATQAVSAPTTLPTVAATTALTTTAPATANSTPATPGSSLPCLGGAAPLSLLLGLWWGQRRPSLRRRKG
jgi:methionine-rich copper-binding protein CopC